MESEIIEIITSAVIREQKLTGMQVWREPLISFASALDPMMDKLKTWVSPKHLQPKDLLPEAESVIVFYLPFFEGIPKSNRANRLASSEWVDAYIETNKLIAKINDKLNIFLTDNEYRCVTTPPTHNFDPKELISYWSHRHLAYIAGLGTFGMNNMLITDKGTAGRFGSCVTDMKLLPGQKPEIENCLYKAKGTCGLCIKNCVNGALTFDRFDRFICYNMCLENNSINDTGILTDVCGKCVSGMPCSNRNPIKQ